MVVFTQQMSTKILFYLVTKLSKIKSKIYDIASVWLGGLPLLLTVPPPRQLPPSPSSESLREAAKKVLLLMAGPLRGDGRKAPGH